MPPKGANKDRIAYEKEVIAGAELVEGVVVRPGWVYGGTGGSYIPHWFGYDNEKGEVEVFGNPDRYWSWVHIVDLADAFLRLAEAGKNVVGEIFDVSDSSRVTVAEARLLYAKAAGLKPKLVVLSNKSDAFSQLANCTSIPKCDKIYRLVGWVPKNGPIQDSIELSYRSYKANLVTKEEKSSK